MKLESNNLLEKLDAKDLKFLTTEVKETLARDTKKGKRRVFSLTDLWHIHRSGKNNVTRRTVL